MTLLNTSMNAGRRLWIAALALALAAPALFALQGSPQPAGAQDTTFVSNLGQDNSDEFTVGKSTTNGANANGFTTGSNVAGYTLSSVQLDVREALDADKSAKVKVELWSAASGGGPGSRQAGLTAPTTISAGTVSFTAPTGTTLAASTTYYVVVSAPSDTDLKFNVTKTADEDSGAAAGWSIEDADYDTPDLAPGDSTTWTKFVPNAYVSGSVVKIAIKGTAVPALVANTGQTGTGTYDLTAVYAQGFTTGSNANGYTLTSIVGAIADSTNAAVTAKFRAELWSAATNGGPDEMLASLVVPTTITAGMVSFAAPEGTMLSASTTYFAVFYSTEGERPGLDATTSTSEDAGSATGWSIGNQVHTVLGVKTPGDNPSWTAFPATVGLLRIAVYGEVSTAAPPTTSDNADLSALAVTTSDSSSGTFDALTLSPSTFDAATTAYTAEVTNDQTHAKVTATVADTGKATVTVEGNTVTSGTASTAIPLAVGATELNIVVTAEDSSTKEYTVTVTRAAALSTNADLSALTSTTSTDGTNFNTGELSLSPAFAAATTSYTASVASTVSHVKLTPTVADTGKATVTVEGTGVSDGTASGAIALAEGDTELNVEVTAEDGVTTREYTITVTRAAAGTVLVKNTGQSPTTTGTISTANNSQAQAFSTGSASGGYTLSAIDVVLGATLTSTQRDTVKAQLRASHPVQSGNIPATTVVANLTVPSAISSGTVTFAAPDGTTLAASTEYFLVIWTTGNANLNPGRTFSDDEDSGKAVGWSIRNTSHQSTNVPSGSWSANSRSLRIAVKGTQATSTNADLSALTANSSTDNSDFTASLNFGAFDKATTTYTASVDNSVTHIKVTPTVEDTGNATVKAGLRGSLAAVTSGSPSAAIALAEGANTVDVEVTAQDTVTTKTYTITVTRAAPQPTISLSSSATNDTAAEGDAAVTLTVTLSAAAPSGGVSVALARDASSTAATADYTLGAATVTVAQNMTTATTTLTIADDTAVEAHESLVLNATASGHTGGSLTFTITDDDTPAKPTSLSAAAGDAKLDLTWTAPAGVLSGYDVHYTSADKEADGDNVQDTDAVSTSATPDPATEWVDAKHTGTTASDSLTSLDNDIEYRVRVRAVSAAGDGAFEFTTGTPAEPTTPTITLSSSDADDSVSEGNVDSTVTLTVTLNEAAGAGGVTVTLARQGASTATATADYTLSSSSLTIAQGATSGTVTLTIKGDRVDEDDESLVLAASASGWTSGSLTFGIADDDTRGVTVSQTTRTVEVGETTTYTIKLNSDPGASVVIKPTSADTDKATVSGALTFTAGSSGNWGTPQTVTITGVAAGAVDITHAITTGSTAGKYPTSLTIPKVATTVTASTKTYEITSTKTVDEDVSAGNVELTVTLGRAPTDSAGHTLSVAYGSTSATTDVDASAADRGSSPPTSVTVAQNATTATLSIPINDDDLVEGDETFTVTISTSASGWNPKTTGANVATVTITDDDDDDAKIAFGNSAGATAIHTVSVDENVSGAQLTVPVTVSHLPQASTTFNVAVLTTGSNRATEWVSSSNPGDFRIMTKSITFADTGAKTKNLTITLTDDALVEWDENIYLQIEAADSPVDDLGDHYGRHASGAKATVTITDNERGAAKIAFGTNAAATAQYEVDFDENNTDGTARTVQVPVIVTALPSVSTTFEIEVLTDPADLDGFDPASEYQDAMNPGDFRIATKSVTFDPGDGDLTENLSIALTADELVEGEETLKLRIKAAKASTDAGYGLGDVYARNVKVDVNDDDNGGSEAFVLIDDDEWSKARIAFGSVAASTVKYTADVDETTATINVPVTINYKPEKEIRFFVTSLDASTATEYTDPVNPGNGDFLIATKKLTFTKTSALTQNLVITVRNDELVEHDQTIELRFEERGGGDWLAYYEGQDNNGGEDALTATVTIEDDEQDKAKIAIGSDSGSEAKATATLAEGASGNVTLTISHKPESDITIDLEVLSAGTARETDDPNNAEGNPKDYVLTKSVTFGPGRELSQQASLAVEDDAVEEDDETLELRIKAARASTDAAFDLGDYYARHADGSLATYTLTSDDAVSEVTIKVPGTANDQGEFILLEGTAVTLTATADIHVGPGGWALAWEHLVPGNFMMSWIQSCQSPGQFNIYACPNDYTLPAITIAEGQKEATGTLRLTQDSRAGENAAERLDLTGTATRGSRSLTTNELALRIDENRAGISLGLASLGMVPGETRTYTVRLRGKAPTQDVTITPASGDTDKATVSGALTFTSENWQDPQQVTVTAVATGTATITHTSSSDDTGYNALSGLGEVAVTVVAAVQNFQIVDTASGAEGGTAELTVTLGALAPTGGLEFSVNRSRPHKLKRLGIGPPLNHYPVGTPVYPNYEANRAAAGDFTSRPSTLTVPAGERRATLTDAFADDDLAERDEHYYVVISTSATGWSPVARTHPANEQTCGQDAACSRVTITDPDRQEASVAFGSDAGGSARYTATVSEAAGTVTVPVTISAKPYVTATFTIEVLAGGTATEDADYSIATKSVTFGPSSALTQNLTITLTDDAAVEADETIALRIRAAADPVNVWSDHYERRPGASEATITLTSDDGGVVLSESGVTVSTGEEATYSVRLTGLQPAGTVTISVTSSDETKATVSPASLDFTTANWNEPQTVTVTGVADGTATITHAVTAAQTGYPTSLSIGSVGVTVSALPTVSLAVAPNPVPEGQSVTVTLTLSEAVGTVKTLPIVLTAGTAEAGDYGTLANIGITASGTSFTATITTTDDADTEDETFTVALGALPSSVTPGTDDSVLVTISDGDTNTVSLSASPNPVTEGDSVTITATLAAALSNDVTIPLTITDGSADTGDRGALAAITVVAGDTTGTGEITTHQDTDTDNETFTVALDTDNLPPSVVAGARATVTVTITDDDRTQPPRRTGGGPTGGGPTGGGPSGGGPSGGDDDADDEEPEAVFADVDAASVHAANIETLHTAGITVGCGANPPRFCPDQPVTRAQMATFLVRALKLEPADTAVFADIDADAPHAADIEALRAAGITVGCGADPPRFCPDQPVTRAQMATFLVRALDLTVPDEPDGTFADVDAASVHAANIETLHTAGITVGCGANPLRYCPDQPVTRAQMATFLVRALKLQ